MFWLGDPVNGAILYVSPAFEAVWGRSCESLYQSPLAWLEAVHVEDREHVPPGLLDQAGLRRLRRGLSHCPPRRLRPLDSRPGFSRPQRRRRSVPHRRSRGRRHRRQQHGPGTPRRANAHCNLWFRRARPCCSPCRWAAPIKFWASTGSRRLAGDFRSPCRRCLEAELVAGRRSPGRLGEGGRADSRRTCIAGTLDLRISAPPPRRQLPLGPLRICGCSATPPARPSRSSAPGRRHRTQAPGRPVPPGPENGSGRPPGGRRRP